MGDRKADGALRGLGGRGARGKGIAVPYVITAEEEELMDALRRSLRARGG